MSIVPRQKHIFNNIFDSFLLKLECFSPDYRRVDQVQPGKTAITTTLSVLTYRFFSDLQYIRFLVDDTIQSEIHAFLCLVSGQAKHIKHGFNILNF